MKTLTLLLVFWAISLGCQAQKFITKTGSISFFSHTPVEDIKADNNQVASIVDIQTGEVVFNVLIKSFVFEKALMQEHFNENYMESDKFPKSSFKGKIDNLEAIDFGKDGSYPASVTGEITIHGVTRPHKTTGEIEVKNGKVFIKSHFKVLPADFNIEIPSVVSEKIAKAIEVTVNTSYEPLQK